MTTPVIQTITQKSLKKKTLNRLFYRENDIHQHQVKTGGLLFPFSNLSIITLQLVLLS
jgi:hypothetical protein